MTGQFNPWTVILLLLALILLAGSVNAWRRQRGSGSFAAAAPVANTRRDIAAREALASGEAPHVVLRDWLQAHSRPPLADQDREAFIAALESRYAVVLPEDFRRYLLETASRIDIDDDNAVAWWGLERVKNISEEWRGDAGSAEPSLSRNPEIAVEQDKYIVFADYMIWCWAWAICCSDGPNRGRIAVIGDKDVFVADSLSDFIRDYLTDEHELTHRGL